MSDADTLTEVIFERVQRRVGARVNVISLATMGVAEYRDAVLDEMVSALAYDVYAWTAPAVEISATARVSVEVPLNAWEALREALYAILRPGALPSEDWFVEGCRRCYLRLWLRFARPVRMRTVMNKKTETATVTAAACLKDPDGYLHAQWADRIRLGFVPADTVAWDGAGRRPAPRPVPEEEHEYREYQRLARKFDHRWSTTR